MCNRLVPPADARPHPIRGILAMQRIKYTEIARQFGYSPLWINLVVQGRGRPSPELAQQLATLAGVSVNEAFHAEVLG